MLHGQATKKVALDVLSVTAGATSTLQIDRLDYDYATIDVLLGKVSNASNVPFVIRLDESDDTNSSNFAAVSGSSHTSNVTALPTTGVTVCTWNVNLLPRKRYINVVISPQATEIYGAVCNLSRARVSPINATGANVQSWLVI